MLHTYLTSSWHLRYPIIGAPMAGVGTCLLASPECDNTEVARLRIVQAQETETVLTRAFDVGQGIPFARSERTIL